jgi:RimJ/RimL family protein N-acetyltransferase
MLTTERLILRRWRPSDREPFARLNGDPRVMEHYPAPLSPQESDSLVDRIESHFRRHGFGFCAVALRHSGEFIGFIGLNIPAWEVPCMPCVEIGWRLAPEHWGRGLATEGARAVVRHAFDALALEQIVAFTTPGNVRSWRVMEKLGMTHDSADDFDHPKLPAGHPLRRHLLYRLSRAAWEKGRGTA